MIPARHFPLGEKLVWWLISSSLRKHFDRVFLRTPASLADERITYSMIMCANHSSWWDGYIAALVKKQFKLDGYLMMEEAQLKRYFFFSWIGCFSVERSNGRSAIKSLQYAANLLKTRPRRMIWIFPQGEITPNDSRPLVFFNGVTHIAKLATPVLLYPTATRIEYLAEQRPDLFISIGKPVLLQTDDVRLPGYLKIYTQKLESLVTSELDQLRDDVVQRDYSTFTQILKGNTSTNRLFDALLLRKQINRQ